MMLQRWSLWTVLSFFLFGCATNPAEILTVRPKAELTITVDLYDEDPRFEPPISPQVAQQLLGDLARLAAEGVRRAGIEKALADEAFAIFEAAWLGAEGSDLVLGELRSSLEAYEAAVDKRLAEFLAKVESANQATKGYLREYAKEYEEVKAAGKHGAGTCTLDGGICSCTVPVDKKTMKSRNDDGNCNGTRVDFDDEWVLRRLPITLREQETDALAAVADAVSAYRGAGDIPNFRIDWSLLENLLNAQFIGAQEVGNEGDVAAYRQLGVTLQRDIQRLATRTAMVAGVQPPRRTSAPRQPTTLAGSSTALANELESLRNDLPHSATALTALSNLVRGSGRFLELIDRLQDAGDPVWRIVTDPDNENRWQRRFTRTYFEAEGETSVIVVRDNPMRYRVQHGHNNPAALIQGQLEITRSLANAALSIAGAVSGIPTDALATATGSGAAAAGAEGGEAKSLAQRKAEAEERARIRIEALRSLQRNLRSIAVNLATVDGNQDAVAAQARRLAAILIGHKPLFEAPPE